jgi:serine phosphatase RsbU (regulator of sigma subunit)
MSLRTRLILAFFLLSVVPLGAVTFYSYTANVDALRDAAEREADLLAGELGQRMQLVTAQLSERVEHLMDIAELQSAAEQAEATYGAQIKAASSAPATAATATPAQTVTVVQPMQVALTDSIAKSLGEAAMLLNNVELRNMRSFGGGRGQGGPPPAPGAPRPPNPQSLVTGVGSGGGTGATSRSSSSTSAGSTSGAGTSSRAGDAAGSGRDRGARGFPRQGTSGRGDQLPDAGRRGSPPPDGLLKPPPPGAPASPSAAPAPQVSGTKPVPQVSVVGRGGQIPPVPGVPSSLTTVDPTGKLRIDMAPIRREMLRQFVPDGRLEKLTPEQRQQLAAEMNQRMLGIEQGIKISAAQMQKQAEQIEQAAANAAAASTAASSAGSKTKTAKPAQARPTEPVAPAPASPADTTRKSTLKGSQIDVKIERNGEVLRQMNAEINLPNVLATVFTTTRKDRGELPFAVAKDGTIFARSDEDKKSVAALGDVAKHGGPATARMNDWIVVTTQDKSGSDLRLGIARPVGDSLASLRRTTARNAGLGLVFIAIALVGIVPLSAGLTRNLSVLSEGVARIARGDYRARVPVKANDEIGQLASAFNKMASDVELHQRTAVEQERIRRELELGRQIQNEMLPHAPLHLGLTQVAGVSVPAREVGGDFFNYFVLDTGHVALLMGDVSGKGVGAALLMANIQAALKARLGLGQDLSAVADALDRDIDANSPGPVYATLFLGILDPATRRLRYVNAGHNPQFVLRSGSLERMPATGLPVGLLSGRGYSEMSVQLSAGDMLFLYTDGCVEAENEQGEMFGMERLEPLLVTAAGTKDPLKRVEQGISAFRGRSEPSDDATLMTVRVG